MKIFCNVLANNIVCNKYQDISCLTIIAICLLPQSMFNIYNYLKIYPVVESFTVLPAKTGSDLLAGGCVFNTVAQLALVALAACQGDVGQDVEYLA